jgi:hypothetical protein
MAVCPKNCLNLRAHQQRTLQRLEHGWSKNRNAVNTARPIDPGYLVDEAIGAPCNKMWAGSSYAPFYGWTDVPCADYAGKTSSVRGFVK